MIGLAFGHPQRRLTVRNVPGLIEPGCFVGNNPQLDEEKYRDKDCGTQSAAFEVLVQPRHDFNEIAGHVPIVELLFQDAVPCVLAGAR